MELREFEDASVPSKGTGWGWGWGLHGGARGRVGGGREWIPRLTQNSLWPAGCCAVLCVLCFLTPNCAMRWILHCPRLQKRELR